MPVFSIYIKFLRLHCCTAFISSVLLSCSVILLSVDVWFVSLSILIFNIDVVVFDQFACNSASPGVLKTYPPFRRWVFLFMHSARKTVLEFPIQKDYCAGEVPLNKSKVYDIVKLRPYVPKKKKKKYLSVSYYCLFPFSCKSHYFRKNLTFFLLFFFLSRYLSVFAKRDQCIFFLFIVLSIIHI